MSKYLINHDKVYETTIKLGVKTDTGDKEGNIIKEKDVNIKSLKKDIVLKSLQNFKGVIEQVPPMYSAVKVRRKKTI